MGSTIFTQSGLVMSFIKKIARLTISHCQSISRMDSDVPSWASEHNLQANGLYFEGFVDDLEAVLDYHKILTVRENHPVYAGTGTSGLSRASIFLLYSGLFQIGTGTAYLLVIEVVLICQLRLPCIVCH